MRLLRDKTRAENDALKKAIAEKGRLLKVKALAEREDPGSWFLLGEWDAGRGDNRVGMCFFSEGGRLSETEAAGRAGREDAEARRRGERAERAAREHRAFFSFLAFRLAIAVLSWDLSS